MAFPAVSKADWVKAVKAELGGVSPDGIRLEPLYTAEDGLNWPPLPGHGWLTRQDLDLADPESLNREAREAERQGVQVVGVRLDRPSRLGQGRSGEDGLKAAGQADLLRAVEGLQAPLALVAGAAGWGAMAALHARVAYLELDLPEALLAGQELSRLTERWAELLRQSPDTRLILSFESLHEAGANRVTELGWGTALTIAWLRAWPAELGGQLDWSYAASSQLLLELAKLRAARVLADNLGAAFAVPSPGLHVRTGRRELTCQDPPNNLLRLGLGALAGALCGALTVHVDPYTQPQGADSDSLRLARGQQHLLRYEGLLDAVGDPAAGAYALEQLASSNGRQAWELVQQLERDGGAATQGQRLLAELERDRQAHRVNLVGVTRYTAPGERLRPASAAPLEVVAQRQGELSYQATRERLQAGGDLLESCASFTGPGLPRIRFEDLAAGSVA